MAIVCLGLSHHTASAEIRERHAFPPGRIEEALVALRDYEAVNEAAIISTCNRLEIYAELEEVDLGLVQLKEFLTNFRHGSVDYSMEPYLYTLCGHAAVEHLFRVSTGLDSMLIGDAEVLGQVKTAYTHATHARSVGTTLHRLFRDALNAGKAARSQTTIGNESISIATAAIALAKQHVGALKGKSVLLIGAGQMGRTAAKRLKLEGATEVFVANRTHERARDLVASLGIGQAVELESLVEALKLADVVITSTGAPHFVLTPAKVAEAMHARPERPIFLVDVAVPRDVDPEVVLIPGVRLADIDQMRETVDVTLEHRRAAIPLVESIIDQHLTGFDLWSRSQAGIPTISLLSQKADSIRQAEVERLFHRCPELTERQRTRVSGMALTIVSKLLHSVMTRIRDDAGDASAEVHAHVVDALFELRLDQPHHAPAYTTSLGPERATVDVEVEVDVDVKVTLRTPPGHSS